MQLRPSRTRLAAAVSAALLAACGAVPTVKYTKIENAEQAKDVADSFYLASSEIVIDRSETKDKDKTVEEFSIVSRPVAHRTYKVGVRPDDSWRVSTKVNIVKIENTDLVASIGVETTDNTASVIGQIGGAIVKVIGLVGVLAPVPDQCIGAASFPVRLKLPATDIAGKKELKFAATGEKANDGCITVSLEDLPVDATQLKYDEYTSRFYYSACRDAVVTFKNPKLVTKKVRIADPNFVQFVQMPYKGSVTAHSECGVSVKTDATAPSNGAQVVDALAAQGKAIKDAIDAAKK